MLITGLSPCELLCSPHNGFYKINSIINSQIYFVATRDFCFCKETASCVFVRQPSVCPTKTLALRGRAFSRVERLLTRNYGYQPKTDRQDRKEAPTPSHKYSFRIYEEQNIRLYPVLCKAGLEHNRSRFIVKRIFEEEFVVIKRDPSKVQFVARLNDFYFQFQKLGNNYNQIVKAVNAHFSNITIPHQIAMLEQRTRELKALSIEILNLAKQAKEWLRI